MSFVPDWLRGAHTLASSAQSNSAQGGKTASSSLVSQVKIEQVDVPLHNLREGLDGLRIAQLSDIHLGPYTSRRDVQLIVRRTNRLGADLIVLTGDYVHAPGKFADVRCSIEECARELSYLDAPLGVFAVLGNHDALMNGRENYPTADLALEVLATFGLPVLENVAVPLYRNGARFWLLGVEDMIMCNPNLDMALQCVEGTEPRILLCHEPDFAADAARYNIDLQLSGHSHGGQIVLPKIGPVKLPYGARLYPTGLAQVGTMQLYTTRGIGYSQLPIRLNCPPEITLLTLRNASGLPQNHN